MGLTSQLLTNWDDPPRKCWAQGGERWARYSPYQLVRQISSTDFNRMFLWRKHLASSKPLRFPDQKDGLPLRNRNQSIFDGRFLVNDIPSSKVLGTQKCRYWTSCSALLVAGVFPYISLTSIQLVQVFRIPTFHFRSYWNAWWSTHPTSWLAMDVFVSL